MTKPTTSVTDGMQERFLSLLPAITRHASIRFRGVCCQQRRDDLVSEVVALCWQWFVRLIEKGKDPCAFSSIMTDLAVRAVMSGRKLAGMEKANDVMNRHVQQRLDLKFESLGTLDTPFSDALADHRQSIPAQLAAFRIDFASWLERWSVRDRKMIATLATGETTQEGARTFRVSPSRVSQKRREFHKDWLAQTAEPQPASA